MSQRVLLFEYVAAAGPMKVDREAGVIHDVKVLGNESANGRTYPPATIEKARGLYEGRVVNADHPPRAGEQTSIARRLGWLEGVYTKAGELFAKSFHYLKSHPMAEAVAEAAERNPRLFGLSHNAHGVERRENGRTIIESIEAVHSVDLVADPATVGGLFESRGTPVKKRVRDLIESLKPKRPRYARALKEMAEAGLMSPDAEMEAPPEEAPVEDEAGEDVDHEQAILDACKAVLDDGSVAAPEKLQKIKKLLGVMDSGKGEGEGDGPPPADDEGDSDSEAKEESRRLRVENAGLKLLNEAGIKLDKLTARALAGCHTLAEVRELVEEARPRHKAKSAAATPAGAHGPKQLTEDKVPEGDGKVVGRWLRG
jgi:hypothetical protein